MKISRGKSFVHPVAKKMRLEMVIENEIGILEGHHRSHFERLIRKDRVVSETDARKGCFVYRCAQPERPLR